jgi:hypothetical protein
MNLAAAIERMEAAGMDPASILLAVKCIAPELSVSKVDEQAERRRAADRERKRLRNSAESAESAEVPSPLVPPLSPAPLSPPIIPPTPVSSEASSDKKPRRKADYSEAFNAFWAAYPTDPGMSKIETFKTFDKLTPEDQQSAINALPAFREWCRKQGDSYRTVHACRYLSQRRFEGFQKTSIGQKIGQTRVPVFEGSPAWNARKAAGERFPTTDIKDDLGRVIGRGWYFETEYPQEVAA